MTKEFKFLIDTNIVIGLEDNHEVDESLTTLVRKCSTHKVRIFTDRAVNDDLQRDQDEQRKSVTLSKLAKFEELSEAPYPSRPDLVAMFGTISNENDHCDCRLLHRISIGAADFLITQDAGLAKRAMRSGLGHRVMNVNDAINWLGQTFEPKTVELPYIREVEAYAIDRDNPIFDGLKSDYPGFEAWFEKCARDHRMCWVVEISDELAGIIIRKEEVREESDVTFVGEKILKLCTFKMRAKFRGQKFGEQLLKQSLWYAQTNEFDIVYLTAFPDKVELIDLLKSYGFCQTTRNENGEFIFEKRIIKDLIPPPESEDVLEYDRSIYPRFFDGPSVKKFYVPIQGEFHIKLFPEISMARSLPLFAGTELDKELVATRNDNRTPGNTIRKVYVCRSQIKSMLPGDILFFYLSKNSGLEASQCVTTVGIVEQLTECKDLDELIRLTAKRSVYSADELEHILKDAKGAIKVIDFLLIGHTHPPVPISKLIEENIIKKQPPQSISKIDESRYEKLKAMLDLTHSN